MARHALRHGWLSLRRLRGVLLALWLVLLALSLGLIVQTEKQIRWEAFHQYRALAEELAARIDASLQADIRNEDARSAGDYQFLTLSGSEEPSSRLLQRSPLAAFPPSSGPVGTLGHFQVDAEGGFSTPLLPAAASAEGYGLDAGELRERGQRSRELLQILARNELVISSPGRDESSHRDQATEQPAESESRAYADALEEASESPSSPRRSDDQRQSSIAGSLDKTVASAASANSDLTDAEQGNEGAMAAEKTLDEVMQSDGYLSNQRGFDELKRSDRDAANSPNSKLGRLNELKLQQNYAEPAANKAKQDLAADGKDAAAADADSKQERSARKEQVADLGPSQALDQALQSLAQGQVRMFESELDPFEFSLLGDGHGLLYRRIWREGQRFIQGLLFDQAIWISRQFASPFEASPLAPISDLLLVYRGDVLQALPGQRQRSYLSSADLQGEVLLQTRLSAPYADIQLVWTVNDLPAGPGARAVRWTGAVLLSVLSLVFLLLYWLGRRQIELSLQQQDFVSAVSHELKTPLTSIRMYGELLLQGWASDEKKREYYGFIHDESERLSRLISNVLQLARMERNELSLCLESRSVASLLDLAQSKLSAQVERAGFQLSIAIEPEVAQRTVHVDPDACLQILINLVDNALKFSRHAVIKQVDVSAALERDKVLLRVRDYGPGIPDNQLQKIFRLFYRIGSELTRETIGTGIGLALARQLADAMNSEISVRNRDPGAEFELRLPL